MLHVQMYGILINVFVCVFVVLWLANPMLNVIIWLQREFLKKKHSDWWLTSSASYHITSNWPNNQTIMYSPKKDYIYIYITDIIPYVTVPQHGRYTYIISLHNHMKISWIKIKLSCSYIVAFFNGRPTYVKHIICTVYTYINM